MTVTRRNLDGIEPTDEDKIKITFQKSGWS